jgi:hypothetical protein
LLEPLVERREASVLSPRDAPRLASAVYLVRLAALRSPLTLVGVRKEVKGTPGAYSKPGGEALAV